MSEQRRFRGSRIEDLNPRPFPVLRPHWTRRRFFELAGAGVTAALLSRRSAWASDGKGQGVTPKNTAQDVIFILLKGAPSHLDTFDLKMINGVTPASFAPEEFRLLGRELYAWCPNGIGRSKLLQALTEKRLGTVGTARNWKTVTALLALADESADE